MSTQSPFSRRGRMAIPTVPKGDVIGSYETYPEAQKAVDELARADFPVNQVSIVGSDLKTVERVTGKLTWGRVALAGAASGAWLGVFFGILLTLFSASISLGLIIAAVLIGAGFGMLFGLASYAINRRRRDYTSMTQVLAGRYDVVVDPQLGNRARNLIEKGGQATTARQHGEQATHPVPPAARGNEAASDAAEQRPATAAPREGRPRYGEYSDEPQYDEAQHDQAEPDGTEPVAEASGDTTTREGERDGD